MKLFVKLQNDRIVYMLTCFLCMKRMVKCLKDYQEMVCIFSLKHIVFGRMRFVNMLSEINCLSEKSTHLCFKCNRRKSDK